MEPFDLNNFDAEVSISYPRLNELQQQLPKVAAEKYHIKAS